MTTRGRVLSRLNRQILAAMNVPPNLVGKPPLRCLACTRAWRGFDGDDRSACCGSSRMALIEAHGV